MIKRRKIKSHVIIIGSLLILLGIALPLSKNLYERYLNHLDNKKIEEFFQETNQEVEVNDNELSVPIPDTKPMTSYNYIAVVEIPSISLKRGLVSINDKANNISQNIQILHGSDMPDIVNGVLMLASHSGSGRTAFFQNLHKVQNNEIIYIYYNHIKYTYKVVNRYIEPKDGDIVIHRNSDETTLVLTTCSNDSNNSQFVVISELVNQENY